MIWQRLEHTKLTHAYLNSKRREPKCELCDVKQTGDHFIITCPKYNQKWIRYNLPSTLDQNLGAKFSFKNILAYLRAINIINYL